MPKEIMDAKEFMELFQEPAKKAEKEPAKKKAEEKGEKKDAKEAKKQSKPKTAFKKRLIVKTSKKITKFKLRTSRRLYTFKTDNQEIAKKIMSSLPSTIQPEEIKKKKIIKKKK